MVAPLSRREVSLGALALGLSSAIPASSSPSSPEAVTRQGQVRGFLRNGASIFLGLPYGADTSGPRRFRPPLAPAPWSGVRDATKPGPRAPQADGPPPPGDFMKYFTGGRANERLAMQEPMSEDCLVLNVLTPAVDGRRRPVLFYIHGGGFTSGSGLTATLGDRFVVREDVVLVTVNHRLGALGYMYLGDVSPEFAVGNPGILDLVAALKWVRENIASFGGDPRQVTIFGESGGGAKISLLLAMQQAKGLFRGAVIQSGLLIDPVDRREATEGARSFMSQQGSKDVKALQALAFEQFVRKGSPGSYPVADGRTLPSEPWAEVPAAAADVPLIAGYCRDELTLFALGDPTLFKLGWAEVPTRLSTKLPLGGAPLLPSQAAESVVAAYRNAFSNDTPSNCFFRISSDATFGRAMLTIADKKAKQHPPVYFYRMEFDTGIPPGLGAIHTAELPMTLDLNWRPESAGLSHQISSAWAAFARTGNPNHNGLPTWDPYDPTRNECMIFDLFSKFGPDPQAAPRAVLLAALANMDLWNPL